MCPPFSYLNKYVTHFKEKAETFNSFFTEQYPLINNPSKPPRTFLKRTEKVIQSIPFSRNDNSIIIWDLHPNKAHGHSMTRVRRLNICGESISKSQNFKNLENLSKFQDNFQVLHRKSQFPNKYKKLNMVQSIRRVISKCQETADLLYCFQYMEKYLRI